MSLFSYFLAPLRQRRRTILMVCLHSDASPVATIILWVFQAHTHLTLCLTVLCHSSFAPISQLSFSFSLFFSLMLSLSHAGVWGEGFMAMVRSCWGWFGKCSLPLFSHHTHPTSTMCGISTTEGWKRGQVRGILPYEFSWLDQIWTANNCCFTKRTIVWKLKYLRFHSEIHGGNHCLCFVYVYLCVFRVLLDRACSDWDALQHELGLGSPISFTHHPVCMDTSHTIVQTSFLGSSSSYSSTYSSDLSQNLCNIKACRWRHFRPWTYLTHDPNNLQACSTQKLSCSLFRPSRNQANLRPAAPLPIPGMYLQD